MPTAKEAFNLIPWSSFGRKTRISELARSIIPVGSFDVAPPISEALTTVRAGTAEHETHLMNVVGTAFQAGRGKLLTCWHVCQALDVKGGNAYIETRSQLENGDVVSIRRRIITKLNFIDPRHDAGNPNIDVGILICPAVATKTHPYDAPVVRWGRSQDVGVGDRVLIGGYPLGRDMFLGTETNRGIVQPSFYDGVISAIIPALNSRETRLLQISTVALGDRRLCSTLHRCRCGRNRRPHGDGRRKSDAEADDRRALGFRP
ncbi:trypsin-like peptidase domain-containing protein [Caulobacter sp. UNC279MFTsu5.1]|uniref:trypsin-like peptidase domain-containing protein n=1 Tax=Caulobacter sp. UNC279MFTsu5.1 TaxID=1502775 RepID=UPI0008F422EA|nr:trypsin-like peptidase domain-containing protein [Caulobacter sp. UNC279MFTsu5.1]SFK75171.1 Trypsin-like peptidase domain-containing protein [Caulobacter sp. UNC279MFTsu5.1]